MTPADTRCWCPCGCGVWRAWPYERGQHSESCFCERCAAKRAVNHDRKVRQ